MITMLDSRLPWLVLTISSSSYVIQNHPLEIYCFHHRVRIDRGQVSVGKKMRVLAMFSYSMLSLSQYLLIC